MASLSKKILSLICLSSVIFFAGCELPPPKPVKTQLQIREMQTRTYTNKDMKVAMKAVINALQDEGFIVKNADKELGFITATKESDEEDAGERFFAMMAQGSQGRYRKNSIIEASANVTEFGKETKVRVIFSQKVLDNFGAAISVNQIESDQYYQEFFFKVDKSLFIEKQKL